MPASHQFYSDWSPQRFIHWASKMGLSVQRMIEKVLEIKQHPEQGYKVCLGILNLSKKVGNERLNRACEIALGYGFASLKHVQHILDKKLDQKEQEDFLFPLLPTHENIRGANYYFLEETHE